MSRQPPSGRLDAVGPTIPKFTDQPTNTASESGLQLCRHHQYLGHDAQGVAINIIWAMTATAPWELGLPSDHWLAQDIATTRRPCAAREGTPSRPRAHRGGGGARKTRFPPHRGSGNPFLHGSPTSPKLSANAAKLRPPPSRHPWGETRGPCLIVTDGGKTSLGLSAR